MKLRSILFTAATVAVTAWTTTALQEEAGMDMATPTKAHARLKAMAGTWDAVVKGMGTESKGTYVIEPAMNGLWYLEDFEGDFMGSSFTGHGVTGYDTEKEKYVSIWVDSVTSRMALLEGEYDEETGTLVMRTEGRNPMTGEPTDEIHRLKAEGDSMSFEMVMVEGGKEIPLMTIDYTRAE